MKNLSKYLIAVLTGLLFYGCETEVDLFADHKEKAVVYGLLDQSSAVQYFRVNPTFIGEGDARIVASDPTLTNYAPGEVVVQLIDLTEGQTYRCEETDSIPLDPEGLFSSQNLLYYLKTDVTISNSGRVTNAILVPGHRYKLLVTKVSTGEQYWGETELGDYNDLNLVVPKPTSISTAIRWMKFHSGAQYVNYTFSIDHVDEAASYFINLTYFYTDNFVPKDSVDGYKNKIGIEMKIGQIQPEGAERPIYSIDFDGEQFYQVLKNRLQSKTQLHGQKSNISVTMIGRDLDAYRSVAQSNLNSITQEASEYSNITNGVGVFSFRSTKIFPNIMINDLSAQEVVNGQYTIDIFTCARYGSAFDSRGGSVCD